MIECKAAAPSGRRLFSCSRSRLALLLLQIYDRAPLPGGRCLPVVRAHRQPFAHLPERADAELTDESGPTPRAPGQPGFH